MRKRRRLPGAVRAEQRVELAGRDREVEPVDRRRRPKLLVRRLSTRAGTSGAGIGAISAGEECNRE